MDSQKEALYKIDIIEFVTILFFRAIPISNSTDQEIASKFFNDHYSIAEAPIGLTHIRWYST
jgi:hypothetical protein